MGRNTAKAQMMEVIEVENKKSLWRVPLEERFINTANHPFAYRMYMELDGIGFLLEYDPKVKESMSKDDFEDFIRHHLVGGRSTECLVEAESEEDARKVFESEWEGAKVGSRGTKSKALRIDEKKKIKRIPDCAKRHKNKRGEYTCGVPIHDLPEDYMHGDESMNMNGEFGMCALEGYDLPDSECPLK